jgi:hypothetical protein
MIGGNGGILYMEAECGCAARCAARFSADSMALGVCSADNASMDLPKILKQLRDEFAQLNESILALERMEAGRTRRRGRPPIWLAEAKRITKPKRRADTT